MNIIIPCGGLGERFLREGYVAPKPLIPAMGKPILFWLLDELHVGPEDLIVVAYSADLEKWRMEDRLRKNLGSTRLKIVHLPGPTRGAAETVRIALEALTGDERVRKTMLLDCDSFYRHDVVRTFRGCTTNMSVVFRDEGTAPIYSYCEIDDKNLIVRMQEKERISPWANTGCYCFADGEVLLDYCRRSLENGAPVRGEYYMSSVISAMIRDGHPWRAECIPVREYVCLGTPLQLRLFCATTPRFTPRRICFDLDGTLITHPIVPGDYATVQPHVATIEYARYLKSLGVTIIVHTARGMRSCGGNVGRVMAGPAHAVYDVLKRFNIPCDELYFGKPFADAYIDDLAHNVCEDLQKVTGFYQTSVAERSHNTLALSTLKTVIKRSTFPLDGEIHWYTNMPATVRNFFPAFIRAAADKTWYEVEKLDCTSCSYLYVNECLTVDHLRAILASLRTIHTCLAEDDVGGSPKMYENYATKLVKRYNSYDYSRFSGAAEMYWCLLQELKAYEEEDCGCLCVVHGDPVLSNVLMESGSALRFIDMRGKQGDVPTIWGDMWYDYAKVFQSLFGYDEILLDRRVNNGYRDTMLGAFAEEVIRMHGESVMETIRMLTASLFFTLIPLHDNEKCGRYFLKACELLPSGVEK
jgi:capsule biosynthesis phosphatase